VVAYHQHVEMLIECIYRVGPGRTRGGGENIRFAANFDDIRSVSAAGAFGMECMDCPTLERRDTRLYETGFV
jgi:hypothetical protein